MLKRLSNRLVRGGVPDSRNVRRYREHGFAVGAERYGVDRRAMQQGLTDFPQLRDIPPLRSVPHAPG
jgi:hypothetical protein